MSNCENCQKVQKIQSQSSETAQVLKRMCLMIAESVFTGEPNFQEPDGLKSGRKTAKSEEDCQK